MLTTVFSDLIHMFVGLPGDPVRIKSIEVSPDPPKPGANMTVKVVGQANEQVEVGFVTNIFYALLIEANRMEHMPT